MPKLQFPEGFLWGTATASHQVEGGNHNNWSEWELANAERLARESEANFKHNPHWQKFRDEATNPANYISGTAVDQYHRYEEDFDLAQQLGHTAHRFSLEWSRIEPEEGVFDERAIEHYRKVIRALRKRNIEPFVTLWHWTHPVWIEAKGSFKSKDFPRYFQRYTEKVVEALGSEVTFWITLNEPDVVASHAYLKGQWPPQEKSFFAFARSLYRLIETHKRAYDTIKKISPQAQVGVAKHQISFEVARPSFINNTLKTVAHYFWNCWFLNKIQQYQDFIGLNHYNRNVIDNGFRKNPNKQQTDFGWEFYPESIYQAIMALTHYHKPIYITENGIADTSDTLRQQFIPRALAAVHRAIADGADVRGYLYWSLLDNFEWDKGFWLRFGLISVDRTTQTRTIRPSSLEYAKICQTNTIETV
jgi:beta-glucosidase